MTDTPRPAEAKREAERSRRRDASQPIRRLYKTRRWQKLRASVLRRDRWRCQLCRGQFTGKGELVCDHREPHRGDVAAFWAGPFWTLCKACHDKTKQKIERAPGEGRWLAALARARRGLGVSTKAGHEPEGGGSITARGTD